MSSKEGTPSSPSEQDIVPFIGEFSIEQFTIVRALDQYYPKLNSMNDLVHLCNYFLMSSDQSLVTALLKSIDQF